MAEMAEIARITVTYTAYTLLEGHDPNTIAGASWEASTEAFERGLRRLLARAYPSARIDVIPSPDVDAVEVATYPGVRQESAAEAEARARDRITQLVWQYRAHDEWIAGD